MCLAIPSKIVSIDTQKNIALVETLGVQREASLDLMQDPVAIDDYVLLHIGYVMSKIDEEDALQSIALYEEMIEKMPDEFEDEWVDEKYR